MKFWSNHNDSTNLEISMKSACPWTLKQGGGGGVGRIRKMCFRHKMNSMSNTAHHECELVWLRVDLFFAKDRQNINTFGRRLR